MLTKGQKANRLGKDKDNNVTINPGDKKLIAEAVLEGFYVDSRSFSTFCKPGMRKLFKVSKPGYKQMSKQTVRNSIR